MLYLDCHGAVSATRLLSIIAALVPRDDDAAEKLRLAAASSIHVATVSDLYESFEVLEYHRQLLSAAADAVAADDQSAPASAFRGGLIILDSAPALLAPTLGGGGQYQGHALMMALAQTLKGLAHKYNCSVLITNYYTGSSGSSYSNSSVGGGSTGKPALGQSWLGVPHHRLDLAELFQE